MEVAIKTVLRNKDNKNNFYKNFNKEQLRSISNLYKSYCTYQMQSMKDDMQNNSVSKDYFTKYLKNNIPKKYISDNLISHSYFSI